MDEIGRGVLWAAIVLVVGGIGVVMIARQEIKAKRAKKAKDAEARKTPAPCGDDTTHYYWKQAIGWPCPVCCAIARAERKQAEERRRARMIAEELAKVMKGTDHGQV